ncbi:MAG: PDZ domain-containing protein [Planctomycetes bacterium]|nr:PDZ domain-containing protein [Planctomycetota bacterium]
MFALRRNFLPASLALLLAATAATAARAAVFAPHGWLGVTLNSAENGPLSVEEIMKGGPAEKAGVKAGDIIVSWNGAKVANLDDLRAFLEKTKAGDEGLLGLRRGDKEVFAKVVLGDREKALEEMGEGEEEMVEEVEIAEMDLDDITEGEAPQDEAVEIRPAHKPGGAFLGVRLEPIEGGVAISSIVEGSPAERIGMSAGEVIRSIDGHAVESAEQVVMAVQAKKPGERIEIKTTKKDGDSTSEFSYVFPLGTAPAAPRAIQVVPEAPLAPAAPLRPSLRMRVPADSSAPHGGVAPGTAHPDMHAQHEIAALRAELAKLHAEMAEMKAMLAEISARLKK